MATKNELKKIGKGTQFSSENQPSGEAKAKGIAKKTLLTSIASQIVEGESAEALEDLAQYLGVDVGEITIETAMHLKQIELAIKTGDTRAYNAVMDRIKGKPLQAIEIKPPAAERPKLIFIKK